MLTVSVALACLVKTVADSLHLHSHSKSAALLCIAGSFILNLQISSCKLGSSKTVSLKLRSAKVTNGVAVHASTW